MLYIMQKIGINKFIVADTDDNSEELCTYDKLKYYITDLGIEIKGAEIYFDNYVLTYCYNNLVDAKAIKFKVLYGISLLVNSTGTLCNMEVDNKVINYVLNLEDWCTSLADFCFENVHIINSDTNITVILSDKIKFSYRAFESCNNSNLTFDFSQLSDKTSAVAYSSFLVPNNSCLLIGLAKKISNVKIVDNRERYAYYVILKALAYRDDLNFCTVRKLTPKSLYNSTIEEIIKNYRPKWFEICNSNIKLSIQGERPILQVDVANFTNVSKILTTVMRYGINVDSFSLNVLLGYLKFICYKDFNLFNAIMSLGKRLKMRYNL